MPKEKKPPLRERIFGPKAQRPSRPPAPVQPAPSGPSAVELSSDSDQKGNAAGTKHRRGLRSIFSRPSKPNTNSVNDADVGETRPAEQDEKLDPWSAAFVQLRKDNSTLVKTYEKILSHQASSSSPVGEEIPQNTPNRLDNLGDAEMVTELASMLQPVLDKYQREAWWKTAAEGADIVISEVGKGVGNALQSCPPAAIAWSAICLAVPILVQPIKQEKKVADGLEYVLERMDWFISLTRVVMKTEWPENPAYKEHQRSTRTEAVKLFKTMLKFEMECACRAYDKHPVVRVVDDMLQLGNWDEKLKIIKDLDKRISRDLRQYQLSELMEHSSQVAENTKDLLVEVRQIRLLCVDDRQFKVDEKLAKLISRFSTTTYLEQMCLNPKRHPGTCMWFRGHSKYRDWLKSDRKDLLLVTAEPGCGKSVLSRFLIEQDLPSRRPGNTEPIVCYFFFKDNTIQSRLDNGLGAIIHQLLMGSEDATAKFAKEISSMSDEMLHGLDTLWRLLERVSEHEAFERRTIYCVFDALDECVEKDRIKLIQLLQSHLQTRRRIQFLVTSRPNPNIVTAFRTWAEKPVNLEGEGDKEKDDLQKEIDIVFRFRINNLVTAKNLSQAVANLLHTKLLAKGADQRTYLWVRLVFELLEKATPVDLDDWEAQLDDLPEGVPGAYDKLLSNVDPRYRERVLSLLHIIYIARRPLTLREANFAVHIRGKYYEKSMESLRLDDNSFQTWLRKECGFFITEYDGRLFFIHQTAREFLIGSSSRPGEKAAEDGSLTDGLASSSTSPAKAWRNSIKSEEAANRVMTECCLASIMVTWQHHDVQKLVEAVEDMHLIRRRSSQSGSDSVADGSLGGEGKRRLEALSNTSSQTNGFMDYSRAEVWHHFHASKLGRGASKSEATPECPPPAGSDPLLAAFDAFLAHPVRSMVFITDMEDNYMDRIDRDALKSISRVQNSLEEMGGSSSVAELRNLLTQAREATSLLYCSPVPWAYLLSRPCNYNGLLDRNKVGMPEGWRALSSTCRHSEELEVLIAMTAVLNVPAGNPDPSAFAIELLRYEEQNVLGHPERLTYFLALLRFVIISLPQSNMEAFGSGGSLEAVRLDSFVGDMAAKWSPELVDLRKDFVVEGHGVSDLSNND